MDTNEKELIANVEQVLREKQSPDLFLHSLRTADYAIHLNKHLNLGLDEEKVKLAALLHDLAKEYPEKRYFEIAAQKGYVFDDLELEIPALMHSRISAFEAESIFGIDDPDVLSAILKHTTGSEGMSQLDFLIFASDKLEPGRDYKSADTLRESIHKDFYRGCLDILQNSIEHLSSKNKTIHRSTYDAINELRTTIFFMDELEHTSEVNDATSDELSDEVLFISPEDKSNSLNGESRPDQYADVIRSIMTLNNWILLCTLLAIVVTFLGSVTYGFYTLYTGIDSPDGFNSMRFSRPPATYFNGRNELLFLLAGLDNVQNVSRTDTIILAKLDFSKHDLRMISIPRDTFVQVSTKRGTHWDRINSAYTGGGNEGLLDTVKNLTGFYPDYLILLNYQGFKDIVDLVGGVEIDVDKDMNYDDNAGNLHIHLKKGLQTLNGQDALGFVRFRHDAEGDFMRIRRQQQFLKTFLQKLYSARGVMKLDGIITRILGNVTLLVIDPENPDGPVTNRVLLVNQYITLAKVLKNIPSENISMETVKIAREGMIDRKSVLVLDYAEFDRTMSEFFSPSSDLSSTPVQEEN